MSAAATAAAALSFAPAAWAVAPVNDNYLASTRIADARGAVSRTYRDVVDTTSATVQPDIFNPDSTGASLGGGPAETTACGAARFGATVWYDVAPEIAGGAEIRTSGYDTVVAVFEYDVRTASIKRMLTCADTPGAGEEVLLPSLAKGSAYTIQVGGSGTAAGMLDFQFRFFGDTDADGVLDEIPDKCPTVRGISEAGGCPPALRSAPAVRWVDVPGGGVRVVSVTISSLPAGARVEVRCKRCGTSQVRVAKGPVLAMTQFEGRFLRLGAQLELFVTRPKTGSGRYRYGAIGNYYRYTARAKELGKRVDRCLNPGSRTPRTRCP